VQGADVAVGEAGGGGQEEEGQDGGGGGGERRQLHDDEDEWDVPVDGMCGWRVGG